MKLWFASWAKILVKFGFTTYDVDSELIIAKRMMQHILNINKMCLSLDRSNGNRGDHPTATYHKICFPQLEKAMPKLALTTTVFSRSNV